MFLDVHGGKLKTACSPTFKRPVISMQTMKYRVNVETNVTGEVDLKILRRNLMAGIVTHFIDSQKDLYEIATPGDKEKIEKYVFNDRPGRYCRQDPASVLKLGQE